MEGICQAGIDKLTPEILRALWLRNILTIFSELGLSRSVQEFYEITKDDLDLIALIILEERELEREMNRKEEPGHGDGSEMGAEC